MKKKCCNKALIYTKRECLSTQDEEARKGYLIANCRSETCKALFITECEIIDNKFIHKKDFNKRTRKQANAVLTEIKHDLKPFEYRKKENQSGSRYPSWLYADGIKQDKSKVCYFDTGMKIREHNAELKVSII